MLNYVANCAWENNTTTQSYIGEDITASLSYSDAYTFFPYITNVSWNMSHRNSDDQQQP